MQVKMRVMTFNVRFDNPDDAPLNTWAKRRDAAINIVRTHRPDVVGMQEAMAHQVEDVRAGLPEYDFFGRPRDLSVHAEYVPLLWSKDRFEAEQEGVFWLSETPDVEASIGWDADNARVATWAVLRAKEERRSFLVVNTHLDRWGELARRAGAELLVARAAERFAGLPMIVTGDMNEALGDPALNVFTSALLRDSYADVSDDAPPTIHHYGDRYGRKIDFVLCDPNWKVDGAQIVLDRPGGQWPSDHFPVIADLELIEDPEAPTG
jgi:endonuclease/exonuclease/phosphatase family metal-dependent hydrolase